MVRALDLSLYVITDSTLAKGRDQIDVIAAAIRGGATVVQLRDKEMPAGDQLALGLRLRELTRANGVALIVNDRVDLALALEADGVHLGQDDLPPSVARQILGPERLIGASAANRRELELVRVHGADYIGVGPFAGTTSKHDAGAPIGSEGVSSVRSMTTLPIVAIGGITAANASAAISAGADGVAVISAVVGAQDPEAAARAILDAVRRARGERQTRR